MHALDYDPNKRQETFLSMRENYKSEVFLPEQASPHCLSNHIYRYEVVAFDSDNKPLKRYSNNNLCREWRKKSTPRYHRSFTSGQPYFELTCIVGKKPTVEVRNGSYYFSGR
jgi:hypothetical protein